MRTLLSLLLGGGLWLIACNTNETPNNDNPPPADTTMSTYRTTGSIERLDPALDSLLPANAQLEILAEGFEWSEGPLWVPQLNSVLFSDIPNNRINRWSEADGLQPYLEPAGYTGTTPRGGEPGSNGLLLDAEGKLVLCQHGDRRMARMEAPLDQPAPNFTTLVGDYEGKRLNSPNDAVYHTNGSLYFTDPPYGLAQPSDQELDFQGVYRLRPDGKVDLLTKELSRPNGIAFSPDEKKLYVAVSDPDRAHYMAYDVERDGTLDQGRILFDATPLVPGRKGLPDGIKVDDRGNLWATGPGGVLILAPDGRHLGTIDPGEAAANCAWGNDGSVLYITADTYLCRIRTRTRGPMPGPLAERRGRTPRPGFRN